MRDGKMEKIAVDMLYCKTLKEVAERNGIADSTLRRMRKTPEFQRILSDIRADAYERVFDAVCGAAPDSLQQLIKIANDEKAPASARVSACRSILETAQSYYQQTELFERIIILEELEKGRISGYETDDHDNE